MEAPGVVIVIDVIWPVAEPAFAAIELVGPPILPPVPVRSCWRFFRVARRRTASAPISTRTHWRWRASMREQLGFGWARDISREPTTARRSQGRSTLSSPIRPSGERRHRAGSRPKCATDPHHALMAAPTGMRRIARLRRMRRVCSSPAVIRCRDRCGARAGRSAIYSQPAGLQSPAPATTFPVSSEQWPQRPTLVSIGRVPGRVLKHPKNRLECRKRPIRVGPRNRSQVWYALPQRPGAKLREAAVRTGRMR